MRTPLKRALPRPAFLLVCLGACLGACLGLAGCNPLSGLQKSRVTGSLAGVKKGMRSQSIIETAGRPEYVNEGEGADFGRDVWVYPTGYVEVVRHLATKVVQVDDPRDLPLPKNQRDPIGTTRGVDYFADYDGYGPGSQGGSLFPAIRPPGRAPPTRYPNPGDWTP